MKVFNIIIEFLNKKKHFDFWGDRYEELSDDDIKYIEKAPTQNPYGLIGMLVGGVAFAFGPKYGFIPVINLIFCIVTFFTFDWEKEDNPWPFYVGIILSLIGLSMFIKGEVHHLII
ncbi:cell division protein FtsK [Neobacillus sp. PS3-40]|uniref:cell division protein FtsK n=1 Tax=Neobacillus sp. PS3-40 TaxID=3070679 RepID=UPI0027DEB2B0|nr:cell division protein FtsK [Neobacillus sp. PS3-40]WML43247.1 cell division protein FtsK [Neobacillus sp. PS3-40]